jgi:hypothetical protein
MKKSQNKSVQHNKMVLAQEFRKVFRGWKNALQSLTTPAREECKKFDLTTTPCF